MMITAEQMKTVRERLRNLGMDPDIELAGFDVYPSTSIFLGAGDIDIQLPPKPPAPRHGPPSRSRFDRIGGR